MTKQRETKASRSEIAGAVHEMMNDAHAAGVVSGATLRSFDNDCFVPVFGLDGLERELRRVPKPRE